MPLPLILYRLSGWALDLVFIILCSRAIQKRWFWVAHYRFLFYYFILITLQELASTVTALLMTNNLFLTYLYTPTEFVLLGLYMNGIFKKKLLSTLIYILSLFFVFFNIYNALGGEGLETANNFGSIINNLYLITLAIFSFTKLFKDIGDKKLFERVDSWFVLAILLIYILCLLADYLYALVLPHKFNNWLYAILITQNILKSCFLIFYLKGISLILK